MDEILRALNRDMKNLNQWLSDNNLKLNVDKTKFMIIKNKYNILNTNNNGGVIIDNENLEQVKEFKYLGVIIDEQLNFENHGVYVSKKIARKVNLMGRIGKDLSQWTKTTIYKTIIHPHFNYCSTVLFLLNATQISGLQKKQNQALRVILKCDRYTNVKYMLDKLQIFSVRQTIICNTLVFIYKMLHRLLPQHLIENCLFVRDIHNHFTRNQNNFYITTVTTSYGQNNLFHNGLKEYNCLPDEIKDSPNLWTFKKRCRDYVKNCIDI